MKSKFSGTYAEAVKTLSDLVGDTLGISRATAEGVLRLAYYRDANWFRRPDPVVVTPGGGPYTRPVVEMVLRTAARTYSITAEIAAARLVSEGRQK